MVVHCRRRGCKRLVVVQRWWSRRPRSCTVPPPPQPAEQNNVLWIIITYTRSLNIASQNKVVITSLPICQKFYVWKQYHLHQSVKNIYFTKPDHDNQSSKTASQNEITPTCLIICQIMSPVISFHYMNTIYSFDTSKHTMHSQQIRLSLNIY